MLFCIVIATITNTIKTVTSSIITRIIAKQSHLQIAVAGGYTRINIADENIKGPRTMPFCHIDFKFGFITLTLNIQK